MLFSNKNRFSLQKDTFEESHSLSQWPRDAELDRKLLLSAGKEIRAETSEKKTNKRNNYSPCDD